MESDEQAIPTFQAQSMALSDAPVSPNDGEVSLLGELAVKRRE